MKGDKIVIKEDYYRLAEEVLSVIEPKLNKPVVITIAGESGSGKSVLATTLNMSLANRKISSLLIQQDDFFKLPPRTNHENRKKDIHKNVGTNEVYLDKLQKIINEFLSDPQPTQLIKPTVNYDLNIIDQEQLDINLATVLIIEGTYTSLLDNVTFKIFMGRTYKETFKNRMNRGRESFDPFIEKVLEIEHTIIKEHKNYADIIVGSDYKIQYIK